MSNKLVLLHQKLRKEGRCLTCKKRESGKLKSLMPIQMALGACSPCFEYVLKEKGI